MTLKPTSNTDLKHGNVNNLRLLSIILNKYSLGPIFGLRLCLY